MLNLCLKVASGRGLGFKGTVRSLTCHVNNATNSHKHNRLADEDEAVKVSRQINSINTRLNTLSLTSEYLRTGSLLQPTPNSCLLKPIQHEKLKLPSLKNIKIESPTTESVKKKTFIQDVKTEMKDPEDKKRIDEPLKKRIKKHAIRMLILRKRKMKKHRLNRLWDKMYLKFRGNRIRSAKKSEIEFRGKVADKVTEARKFDPEAFVNQYLEDFHKPLIPGTYKGKRLPQWLIMELMENDKMKAEEALLDGKTFTTKETIVRPGETVDQFIQRTWK